LILLLGALARSRITAGGYAPPSQSKFSVLIGGTVLRMKRGDE
jgi:hypothetical protein